MVSRMLGGLMILAAIAVTFSIGGCNQQPAKNDDKTQAKNTDAGKGDGKKPPESKETPTILHIPHLNDDGCIAAVKEELVKVKGVADVKGDLKTKTVTVTPTAGAVLSPKALWEAADASGENPSKLDGPSGLFTSKPKE